MSELEELRSDWDSGRLSDLARDLIEFVRSHRTDILEFRDRQLARLRGVPLTDDLAIRMYILQIRSISPKGEIKDQLQEIEREIWYRGEHGSGVDRQEVAREWCLRHAPGWRDHRVMAIIFVFDRIKDQLLELLRESRAVS
jgi:hypothetical protein